MEQAFLNFALISIGGFLSTAAQDKFSNYTLDITPQNDKREVIAYLEDLTTTSLPTYHCTLNISTGEVNRVSGIGYRLNGAIVQLCGFNSTAPYVDTNDCRIHDELAVAVDDDSIQWRIPPFMSMEAGDHNVTCVADINVASVNEAVSEIEMASGATFFSLYKVPDTINITIRPPIQDDSYHQDAFYNFSCKVEGGFPDADLKFQFVQGNKILAEHTAMYSMSSFRTQVTRSHRGAYLSCIDLTHGKRSQHLLTRTTPISKFVFIKRNDKKAKVLRVYKGAEEGVTLQCSDYIDWSGEVAYSWFATPVKSKIRKKWDNEITIRYAENNPRLKAQVHLICAAILINGAAPVAVHIVFPVDYSTGEEKNEWEWRDASYATGIAVVVSVIFISLMEMVRSRIRRRKIRNKALGKVQQLPHMSSLVDSKPGAAGFPIWHKSLIPRPHQKTSQGDVVITPYNEEDTGVQDVDTENKRKSRIKVRNTKRYEDMHRLSTALALAESRLKQSHSNDISPMATWKRLTALVNKTNQDNHRPTNIDKALLSNRPRFMGLVRASVSPKDRSHSVEGDNGKKSMKSGLDSKKTPSGYGSAGNSGSGINYWKTPKRTIPVIKRNDVIEEIS